MLAEPVLNPGFHLVLFSVPGERAGEQVGNLFFLAQREEACWEGRESSATGRGRWVASANGPAVGGDLGPGGTSAWSLQGWTLRSPDWEAVAKYVAMTAGSWPREAS